jgi:hypothetical protein
MFVLVVVDDEFNAGSGVNSMFDAADARVLMTWSRQADQN